MAYWKFFNLKNNLSWGRQSNQNSCKSKTSAWEEMLKLVVVLLCWKNITDFFFFFNRFTSVHWPFACWPQEGAKWQQLKPASPFESLRECQYNVKQPVWPTYSLGCLRNSCSAEAHFLTMMNQATSGRTTAVKTSIQSQLLLRVNQALCYKLCMDHLFYSKHHQRDWFCYYLCVTKVDKR